jgi:hypothetical protein
VAGGGRPRRWSGSGLRGRGSLAGVRDEQVDVAFLVAMNEEIEGIFDLSDSTMAGTKPFDVYE